jgi:hypothetical protein
MGGSLTFALWRAECRVLGGSAWRNGIKTHLFSGFPFLGWKADE